MDTKTISVTAFGETREVEVWVYPHALRVDSVGSVVVGRFPTGTKVHRSGLTLWKRIQVRNEKTYTSQGPTAAVIDGDEYVMDTTLYLHNSNRGRIVAWNDEKWDPYLGKWNRA